MKHKDHCRRSLALLGKTYSHVHRYMDAPYAWKIPKIKEVRLFGFKVPVLVMEKLGRRHRLLRHDLATALKLGLESKDPGVLLAALQHLIDDAR